MWIRTWIKRRQIFGVSLLKILVLPRYFSWGSLLKLEKNFCLGTRWYHFVRLCELIFTRYFPKNIVKFNHRGFTFFVFFFSPKKIVSKSVQNMWNFTSQVLTRENKKTLMWLVETSVEIVFILFFLLIFLNSWKLFFFV